MQPTLIFLMIIYLCLAVLGLHFMGFPLVVENRGYSSCSVQAFHCKGFSCGETWALVCRCQQLLHMGSVVAHHGLQRAGSVAAAHGPSCPATCRIFPDQDSNWHPLHCKAKSQPLDHQGNQKVWPKWQSYLYHGLSPMERLLLPRMLQKPKSHCITQYCRYINISRYLMCFLQIPKSPTRNYTFLFVKVNTECNNFSFILHRMILHAPGQESPTNALLKRQFHELLQHLSPTLLVPMSGMHALQGIRHPYPQCEFLQDAQMVQRSSHDITAESCKSQQKYYHRENNKHTHAHTHTHTCIVLCST